MMKNSKRRPPKMESILPEDELINSILDASAAKARKSISKKGLITLDEAIPLLLRGQYNHIKHLDAKIKNMATKDDIERLEKDNRLLKWMWGIGMSFLALLMVILKVFVK